MGTMPIDINCDVGEGTGNEDELFPFISSCSIACGGHAGDKNSMARMVVLAKKYKVKIGAHPSFPDKENFGRTVMHIPGEMLQKSIREQLLEFQEILELEGALWHHIKPHGALYNEIVKNRELAIHFLKAIESHKEKVFLYAPDRSEIARVAKEQGFKVKYEAFGDRNYNADLSLVSRSEPNALITDPQKVLEHVLHIIKKGSIQTVSGIKVKTLTDTICVHGDTTTALEILMYLSKELPNHQVQPNK